MRPRSISFIRNSLSAYAPFLIDLFLKLAIVRMILHQDGFTTVGMWGLLKSVLALPLFLQEGVCFAIFLDSATDRSRSRLGDVIGFSTFTGLVVGALLLVLAPLFPDFFQVPPNRQTEMQLAFQVAAGLFAVSAPAQAVLYSMRGRGRFDAAAILLIVNSVLNFLLVAYFLFRGDGIIGLTLADLISTSLLLASAVYFHRRLFGTAAALIEWNFSRMWMLAKRTAVQLFYSGTARAFWELDALLIPRFFGIQTMASYWIGRRIPYVYGDFLWAGIWPAVPATQSEEDQTRTIEQIHWIQGAILIPWTIFLFVVAPEVLLLWTGLSDPIAVISMRILLLAVAFDFLPATAISYFFGRSKVLLVAFALFIALVLKAAIALYAAFTNQYQLVLYSTALSALVFASVVLILFKSTSISIMRMLRPVAAYSIASAFSMTLLSLVREGDGLLSLAVRATAFALLTYASAFFLLRVFYPAGFSAFVRWAVRNSSAFHFLYSKPYAAIRRASLGLERYHDQRVQRFENVYRAKEDPWDYQTSEYEQKKYSRMNEFLSGRTFSLAVEVGCSEGVFTNSLAELSSNVIGLDISSTAIQRAQERLRGRDNIEIRQVDVVTDRIPMGADLICCGETLNCLPSQKQLKSVRDKLVNALVPGGWLLLVNLHLFPDDRKGLVLKDMGFGSTDIRNLFLAARTLRVIKDEDHEGYRITLFEKHT